MSGGAIFLLAVFGLVIVGALSRVMSDKKQGKK